MRNKLTAIGIILAAAVLLTAGGCGPAQSHGVGGQERSSYTEFAGTYVSEFGDGGGSAKITLILRPDGTYTKTMAASVSGLTGLGGTHVGTWSVEGTQVRISGDSNWPAYTHDLKEFRRIGN